MYVETLLAKTEKDGDDTKWKEALEPPKLSGGQQAKKTTQLQTS